MDNKIFTVIENKPRITPEGLNIPEFKKLWYNDKEGREKWTAQGELAYVYHMIDPGSSYANLDYELKEQTIIEDFIPKKKQDYWKPNEWVIAAMEKYRKMIETPAVRMLNSAKKVADKYAKYFDGIDLEERDESGNLRHDPAKVMSTLSKIPDMIKAINTLEEEVRKGNQSSDIHVRGGKEFSNIFD